jgi:uncharacterized protein (TIGR03435 family)
MLEMRHVQVVLAAGCIAVGPSLWAQAAPRAAFEVVSIKPHKTLNDGGGTRSLPDGFRWTNVPFVSLIHAAYGVSMDNQIEGLPGWVNSEYYDIEGRADEKTAESWKNISNKERYKQQEPMFQALLADRCHFQGHLVTRELPVYDLVIAKGGLKMKEAPPDEPGGQSMGANKLEAHANSTAAIAGAFQWTVGRMIVDKTGLAEKKFDFNLTWAEDRGDGTADPGPSIFTALEEELGLKLVPSKGPVPVLIIDHIERPSPN